MTDDRDEPALARGMIEVHGAEAVAVARGNARQAALAGQPMQARAWTQGCKATPPRCDAAPPVTGYIDRAEEKSYLWAAVYGSLASHLTGLREIP